MAAGARQRGAGEGLASALVLAALALAAAWVFSRQADFNPAVEVALRAPAPKGSQAAQGQAPAQAQPGETPGAGSEAGPAAPKTSALAALLPEGAGGLAALGPAESFDPQTLSDKIDGKAELYLAAGFKAMADRAYATAGAGKGRVRVDVYLYEMKSPDAAFAVFSGQKRSGAGKSAVAERAYATENAVFFASGAHYAEVIADKTGPEAARALDALARAVAAALPGGKAVGGAEAGGTAKDTDLFPAQGLDAGSLRLIASDVFGVQGLTSVYTAGYRLGQAEASGFLARRKGPAEAQEQAKAYLRFLVENGYREHEGALPGGARLFELDGSFEAVGAVGPFFYGVHDATGREAAVQVAAQLAAQLAKSLEKAK